MTALSFFHSLTKALGKDAPRLLRGLSFDDIQQAAKLQATQGNTAAWNFLQAFKQERKRVLCGR